MLMFSNSEKVCAVKQRNNLVFFLLQGGFLKHLDKKLLSNCVNCFSSAESTAESAGFCQQRKLRFSCCQITHIIKTIHVKYPDRLPPSKLFPPVKELCLLNYV